MLKRTFIALPVPVSEKLRNETDFFRKHLRGLNIKWVELNNLHLTLAFLGNTTPEQIIAIKEGLTEIVTPFKAFTVNFTRAGAFKSLRNPQVLWIGLETGELLQNIRAGIQKLIEKAGFEPESKAFKPHLTIGRVKSFSEENNLQILVNNREELNDMVKANSIVFYESVLQPAGAVYKPLAVYKLTE